MQELQGKVALVTGAALRGSRFHQFNSAAHNMAKAALNPLRAQWSADSRLAEALQYRHTSIA